MKPYTLTRSEMQVMNALWSMPAGKGTVAEIIEHYEEPKPAYTTIATFVKILIKNACMEPEKSRNAIRPDSESPVLSND